MVDHAIKALKLDSGDSEEKRVDFLSVEINSTVRRVPPIVEVPTRHGFLPVKENKKPIKDPMLITLYVEILYIMHLLESQHERKSL